MEFPNDHLKELHNIISKMPLRVFCVAVLPEIGMKWQDVARTIRNSRLAMTPPNVARVICKHIARSQPDKDIEYIVARLMLKSVATQNRKWHVITLIEQETSEPIEKTIELLPKRITQALKEGKTSLMRPEMHSIMLDSLMFISLRLVSSNKKGPILYAVTPPGESVVLVTSLGPARLTRALVEGLGYSKYKVAKLHGHDIYSLLRIHNRHYDEHADNLYRVPEYAPGPVATRDGIDYTNRQYDESYVDNILGPNPPLLTELHITSVKQFSNRSLLNKQITLKIHLKSEDVAMTLKSWVRNGALAPTCEFLKIFDKIKSNDIVYCKDDSD